MIKIIIENKTTWDTKDLRKLFNLICKYEGYFPKTIIVKYGKSVRKETRYMDISIGGLALYNRGWVKLMLPNSILKIKRNKDNQYIEIKETLEILDGEIIKEIAQVLAHEIGHNRGLHHNEMISFKDINVDYVNGLVINRKPMIKKKKADIQKKYDNLLKLIKQWEIKLKRANTYLKKYYKKKKYYEKKYPEQINL